MAAGRRQAKKAVPLSQDTLERLATTRKSRKQLAEEERIARELEEAEAAEEERRRREAAEAKAKAEEEARARDAARIAASQAAIDAKRSALQRLVDGKSRKKTLSEEAAKAKVEEGLRREQVAAEERMSARMRDRGVRSDALSLSMERLARSNASALHRISQSSRAMAELARRQSDRAASVQTAAAQDAIKKGGPSMSAAPLKAAAAAAASAAAAGFSPASASPRASPRVSASPRASPRQPQARPCSPAACPSAASSPVSSPASSSTQSRAMDDEQRLALRQTVPAWAVAHGMGSALYPGEAEAGAETRHIERMNAVRRNDGSPFARGGASPRASSPRASSPRCGANDGSQSARSDMSNGSSARSSSPRCASPRCGSPRPSSTTRSMVGNVRMGAYNAAVRKAILDVAEASLSSPRDAADASADASSPFADGPRPALFSADAPAHLPEIREPTAVAAAAKPADSTLPPPPLPPPPPPQQPAPRTSADIQPPPPPVATPPPIEATSTSTATCSSLVSADADTAAAADRLASRAARALSLEAAAQVAVDAAEAEVRTLPASLPRPAAISTPETFSPLSGGEDDMGTRYPRLMRKADGSLSGSPADLQRAVQLLASLGVQIHGSPPSDPTDRPVSDRAPSPLSDGTGSIATTATPEGLPPRLADVAGGGRSSEDGGGESLLGADDADRWLLTAEHRLLYGAAFESSVAIEGGKMQRARATRHLAKSGLAPMWLDHAMQLVGAPPAVAQISELQFVVAMRLVSKGAPLPPTLPPQLALVLQPPTPQDPAPLQDSPPRLSLFAQAASFQSPPSAPSGIMQQATATPPTDPREAWSGTDARGDMILAQKSPLSSPNGRYGVRLRLNFEGQTSCVIGRASPSSAGLPNAELPIIGAPSASTVSAATTATSARVALGAQTRERIRMQLQEERAISQSHTVSRPSPVSTVDAAAQCAIPFVSPAALQQTRHEPTRDKVALPAVQGKVSPRWRPTRSSSEKEVAHVAVQAELPWSSPSLLGGARQHPAQSEGEFDPLAYHARIRIVDDESTGRLSASMRVYDGDRPWDQQ